MMLTLETAPVFVALCDLARAPAVAPSPRDLAEAPARDPQRARFLARRAFARVLLAGRLGCPPQTIDIARDAQGAPHVVAPPTSLHVSFSSRGNLCAIALAQTPVGVDLEVLDAPFEPPWRALHEGERRRIAASDSPHESFMAVWTAKEAWLKAQGVGLLREPSEIEIRLEGEDGFGVFDKAGPAPGPARRRVVAFAARRLALAWVALA